LAGVEEKRQRIIKKNKKELKKNKKYNMQIPPNCVRVDRFLKETSKTKTSWALNGVQGRK